MVKYINSMAHELEEGVIPAFTVERWAVLKYMQRHDKTVNRPVHRNGEHRFSYTTFPGKQTKNIMVVSDLILPPEAEQEILSLLFEGMGIESAEMAAILKKHGVSGDMETLQDSYRKRLGQRLMASLRDESGRREVLATGKGRYVVLEGCGDRKQLQTIRRRIQGQINGLNESAGKVQTRIRVLDRLRARLLPGKKKKVA